MTELEIKEELWDKHVKRYYNPDDNASAFTAEAKREFFSDLDRLMKTARKLDNEEPCMCDGCVEQRAIDGEAYP